MTEEDCLIIQSKAIAHLFNCCFDDFHIAAEELADEINTNLTGVIGKI